jgi:heptosyltransferase-2
LCPGAEYGPAKRWPAAYFAEVAQRKLAEGWQVWLFGSHKDEAITQEIQTLTHNRCLDLGGRTALGEAIDLLARADAVLTNDSGLMHVAAALGRPVIALFGSSDPHHTPPLSARAQVLSLNLSCSPCFRRVCPLGHTRCLTELAPAEVLTALASCPSPGPDLIQQSESRRRPNPPRS